MNALVAAEELGTLADKVGLRDGAFRLEAARHNRMPERFVLVDHKAMREPPGCKDLP